MRREGVFFTLICICVLMLAIRENFEVKSTTYRGNILYVGGTGANNYTTIQQAIDNASDGDTIFVYNGTYYENVIINKRINLIGEDKNTTIIDGKNAGNVIHINASFVNISNFTIRNSGWGGMGIFSNSENLTIRNNRIINTYEGIKGSIKYSIIADNEISDFDDYGIWIYKGNFIINNSIYNGGTDGIILVYSSNNNIIEKNTIYNIDGYAVRIYASSGNIIKNNTIFNNGDGIKLHGNSFNNSVYNCIICNNSYGIYIDSSNNNTIYNNILNNTNNAWDNGNNKWNVSKIVGKNIVGGPYIAGNYWHDYGGIDADGDGIGDTPYDIDGGNNKDLLPLTGEGIIKKPDLIVTDIWRINDTIYYQVGNIGNVYAVKGHATALFINGYYKDSSIVYINLWPGERFTGYFSNYNLECYGSSVTIKVCADEGDIIDEIYETNNCRNETWKCDETPPKITYGPIAQINNNTATIYWETDENSSSIVKYGEKAGIYNYEVINETMTKYHTIFLNNLSYQTTYNCIVESSDESNNTVRSGEFYFTTESVYDDVMPNITFYNLTNKKLPFEFSFMGIDNIGIERVEFYMDGKKFATSYSSPFHAFFDPTYLNLTKEELYTNHTFMARAFDFYGNSNTMLCGINLESAFRHNEVEVEIFGWNPVIYTNDSYVEENTIVDLYVYAKERVGFDFIYDEMGMPHGIASWEPVAELEFYINDTMIYNCTPSEYVTVYPWNASGLSIGNYTFKVIAVASDGYRYSDEVVIEVKKKMPRLSLNGIITRMKSHFKFIFVIGNEGEADAYLEDMNIKLEGFQPVAKSTDEYAIFTEYMNGACNVTINFSDIVLSPHSSYHINFSATPIMYRGIEIYDVTDISIRYRNYTGAMFQQYFSHIFGRHYITDEVTEALNESDYLIVTNPVNLFLLYNSDSVNNLLSKIAELATLTNGVLACFSVFPSLMTIYDSNDKLAVGNVKDDDYEEVIVAGNDEDRIVIYGPHSYVKVLTHDLNEEDAIAVGNALHVDYPVNLSIPHPWEEVIVVEGDGANAGRVTIYNLNLSDSSKFKKAMEFNVDYEPGDGFAAGDFGGIQDKIVVAKHDTGTVKIYVPGSSTPVFTFDSAFAEGDFFGVADIVGDAEDEIIVAHLLDNRIYVYNEDGELLLTFSTFRREGKDKITLGNVWGDRKAEIIIADEDEDNIKIYYNVDDIFFSLLETLPLERFDEEDGIVSANMMGDGMNEIIIAHGKRRNHFYKGEMEIIPFDEFSIYEHREVLDELLNEGGEWAERMCDNWTTNGYLLIVGEDEIIPAFSCREDDKDIETTDRYYASSRGSSRWPEVATGRMIGEDILDLINLTQISIYIHKNFEPFDTSHALLVPGYPSGYDGDSDEIDFNSEVNNVREKLLSNGFINVFKANYALEKPDGWNHSAWKENRRDYFFNLTNMSVWDLIHLAGHGNWAVWDLINWKNVEERFNPGTSPLVFASSCLTGRYAAGGCLAERFLKKGASAYIGATEISYCCPNKDLAGAFYDELTANKPIGLAFKKSIRSFLEGAHWWDRDVRRYNAAIYHFYGDPKLKFSGVRGKDIEFATINGTLSYLNVTLPMYNVTSINGTDYVTIPYGGLVTVANKPLVPYYVIEIEYPEGSIIHGVRLIERSGLITQTGLNLTNAAMAIAGYEKYNNNDSYDNASPVTWPDLIYTWGTIEDINTTLFITIYPFYYNNLTTESRYYRNYSFEINYTTSPIIINKINTWKHNYIPGENVMASVYIESFVDEPMDVILDVKIFSENDGFVDGLPLRILHNLTGLALVSLSWNSSSFDNGIYYWEVSIKDLNSSLLNKKLKIFNLGISWGIISNFSVTPQYFNVGDEIHINVTFENTGSININGTAIINIIDSEGNVSAAFKHNFSNLMPSQSIAFNNTWNASVRNSYNVIAYVLYDGKSTEIKTKRIDAFIKFNTSLNKGWNLIGSPFNKSIPLNELIIFYDGMNYTWNEAINNSLIMPWIYTVNRSLGIYEAVNEIKPGYGYWIYCYAEIEILMYGIYSNGNYINPSIGWNLIALPCINNVSLNNLTIIYNNTSYTWNEAINVGLIMQYVYTVDRKTGAYVTANEIKAGYGYWIYCYDNIKIAYS